MDSPVLLSHLKFSVNTVKLLEGRGRENMVFKANPTKHLESC